MSAPGAAPRPRLVLLHGFTDTSATWELVRPALEREFDVLAPDLAGHAGGPALPEPAAAASLADGVAAAMDAAGWADAHVAGNSLGGWVALQLAERGRARSVVALAPAGGWAAGDPAVDATLDHFTGLKSACVRAAPYADELVATRQGRRLATSYTTVRYAHIPPDLLARQTRGVAGCDGMEALVALARAQGWPLTPERVACPVRIVWGTADRLLVWPAAAARWQAAFPHADWVVLDDVGHCPQLDVPAEAAELIAGFARTH